MTFNRSAGFLFILLASVFAFASEPPFFKAATTLSPSKVKKGEVTTLVVKLNALQSTKINEEAPVSLEIKFGPELTGSKTHFSRGDAKKAEKYEARWEIPLTTIKVGHSVVSGVLAFYLCTDKWCRKFEHTFSEKLVVSP